MGLLPKPRSPKAPRQKQIEQHWYMCVRSWGIGEGVHRRWYAGVSAAKRKTHRGSTKNASERPKSSQFACLARKNRGAPPCARKNSRFFAKSNLTPLRLYFYTFWGSYFYTVPILKLKVYRKNEKQPPGGWEDHNKKKEKKKVCTFLGGPCKGVSSIYRDTVKSHPEVGSGGCQTLGFHQPLI